MKVAILGDSISEGLGSKKINYENALMENLSDTNICNFAHTGTTINYTIKILPNLLSYDPDVILVFYGSVDAILRPNPYVKHDIIRHLPKRYQHNGMLDPRPFYTHHPIIWLLESIESFCRVRIKKVIMKIQGTYCWVGFKEFAEKYQAFIDLINNGKRQIFLISTVPIDDYYFPGSTKQFEQYNQIIAETARRNHLHFLDIYHVLEKYPLSKVRSLDHFHPNEYGYSIIGKFFSDEILKAVTN